MGLTRRALIASVAAPLAACSRAAELQRLPSLAVARRAIDELRHGWKNSGPWSLPMVLNHAAQSIEYSVQGFPDLKPEWFRASVGSAAFAWFDARGAMRHGLDEPIPGAPTLPADAALPAAIARLQAALSAFEQHTGALAPHFAYGVLDKAQYTRAHLMHLADHWQEFRRT